MENNVISDIDKKMRAINFHDWMEKNTVRKGSDRYSYSGDSYKGRYTSAELYDIFVKH